MLIVTPEEIECIRREWPSQSDLILKDIESNDIKVVHPAHSYTKLYRNKSYVLNTLAGIWVYYTSETDDDDHDFRPNNFKELYPNGKINS
jgi:hypothetical protein